MVEIDMPLLERVASQRRFAPTTLEIARGLFINGFPPRRLALEHGVNVKRVYAIRDQVLAAAEALALPTGWEEVTLAGPQALIEELKRLHAEGMKRFEATAGKK